ncbi:MAG: GNAT family N-acetyltransferase [Pyrinomonadaceae bacterium]
MPETAIEIRECATIDELDGCVRLQREAFKLPDIELSPRRHLIVSKKAGGFTLGAFIEKELVGFVHHLAAVRNRTEIIGYSHMMAVAVRYQNRGVGARLKWAQRERALAEGREFITWTWNPLQARNAHFNINRLGVVVASYGANFYGTDYDGLAPDVAARHGIDSDRLFADWPLRSSRVARLARGEAAKISAAPVASIAIPFDWSALVKSDPQAAQREQHRVRAEFAEAFAAKLICAGFISGAPATNTAPRYLLYRAEDVIDARDVD